MGGVLANRLNNDILLASISFLVITLTQEKILNNVTTLFY